jgi:hypothetical protein
VLSRRQRGLVGCFLLGALLLAPAAQAERDSPGEFRARAHAALDDRIQKEMPGQPERPSPAANTPQASLDAPHPSEPIRVASPLSAVARLLLWCLVVGAIALLVVAVVRAILGRQRDADAAPEEGRAEGKGGRAAPAISLSEAEALALSGQYAEAIHALLQSVLGALGKQGNIAVGPSTTSREVLESVRLEAEARGALSDLVLTVEVSLFGGFDVDEGDYQRCMASYRRLSEALWAR